MSHIKTHSVYKDQYGSILLVNLNRVSEVQLIEYIAQGFTEQATGNRHECLDVIDDYFAEQNISPDQQIIQEVR
jgi:hypothetical protein